MSTKIQIKHQYTNAVLFECEAPEDLPSGMHTRHALESATKSGANLDVAKLIGARPVFQIGPIGSRRSYFVAYLTDQGIKVRAGCFLGTVQEFREKLTKQHGTNNHATEYEAALTLIQTHAELWANAAVA